MLIRCLETYDDKVTGLPVPNRKIDRLVRFETKRKHIVEDLESVNGAGLDRPHGATAGKHFCLCFGMIYVATEGMEVYTQNTFWG